MSTSKTNAKHTTGPWRVVGGTEVRGGVVIVAITDAFATAAIDTRTRDEANARLIAAAPELLANLSNILGCVDRGWTVRGSSAYDEARAAIAKASGTQS